MAAVEVGVGVVAAAIYLYRSCWRWGGRLGDHWYAALILGFMAGATVLLLGQIVNPTFA